MKQLYITKQILTTWNRMLNVACCGSKVLQYVTLKQTGLWFQTKTYNVVKKSHIDGSTNQSLGNGHSMKFRISKIAFTFMAEALAIDETLEITEKIDSEQHFMIFWDSASVLNSISNSSTRPRHSLSG